MEGQNFLIALAFGAIVFTLVNFRLSVASSAHHLFPILSTVSSWAGLSIVVWAFFTIPWYWTLLAIACGYLISYGALGGGQFSGRARMLAILSPILDIALLLVAGYLWVRHWPF
jgi:hypothetical protein